MFPGPCQHLPSGITAAQGATLMFPTTLTLLTLRLIVSWLKQPFPIRAIVPAFAGMLLCCKASGAVVAEFRLFVSPLLQHTWFILESSWISYGLVVSVPAPLLSYLFAYDQNWIPMCCVSLLQKKNKAVLSSFPSWSPFQFLPHFPAHLPLWYCTTASGFFGLRGTKKSPIDFFLSASSLRTQNLAFTE